MQDDVLQRKRAFLLRLFSMGVFSVFELPRHAEAQVLGSVPRELPTGRSVYRLRGRVKIDGVEATADTILVGGETVETGPGAEVVFVVGQDAFLVRQNSRMQLFAEQSGLLTALRITTGAVVSAFGRAARRIETSSATIGIRGTGAYTEVSAHRTYFCTCYGHTEIAVTNEPRETSVQQTHHHDAPKYIVVEPRAGRSIFPAPMLNHSDEELTLIEALVGRKPPFFTPDDAWGPARRR